MKFHSLKRRRRGCRWHHRWVRLRVRPAIPVVTRGVVVLPVPKLDHEALPGRIVIPLAGVFKAGEAVSRRQLERAEASGSQTPE